MPTLSEQCREHLERALQKEEASEKDFHIRQVLQASKAERSSEEAEAL